MKIKERIQKGSISFVRGEDETITINDKPIPAIKIIVYDSDLKETTTIFLSKDFKIFTVLAKDGSPGPVFDISGTNIKTIEDFIEHVAKVYKSYLASAHIHHAPITESAISDTSSIKAYILANITYPLIMLAFLAIPIGHYLRNKIVERKTFQQAEQAMARVYAGHRLDDPVYLKWYKPLIDAIKLIIAGKKNFLIVCGTPGVGKSYVVMRQLFLHGLKSQKDFVEFKGSAATAVEDFIQVLYDNRKKIIIMDDCDAVLDDRDFISILKSAGDSSPSRFITYKAGGKVSSQGMEVYAFPDRFIFEGKIILITNRRMEDIDPALLSRSGGAVNIDINERDSKEMIKDMIPYFEKSLSNEAKMEVYEYMIRLCDKYKVSPDLRLFRICIDARLGSMNDWRSVVDGIVKAHAMSVKKQKQQGG